MKYVLYIMLCLCLPACGDDVVETKYVPICDGIGGPGADAPPIMLPDEVVCNHAPSNNIRVDGNAVTYMCTKVSE